MKRASSTREKSGRTVTYRLVMSVLEKALLAFAQTFGWGLESRRATRVNRHKVARRPVKEKPDLVFNSITAVS